MSVKLLIEQKLEFPSLNGSSESTHVKMPHCWKSHAAAQMCLAQGPQRSDASEARTRGPFGLTLPLSHCTP